MNAFSAPFRRFCTTPRLAALPLTLAAALWLAGCGSNKAPQPAPLQAPAADIAAEVLWQRQLGAAASPALRVAVAGDQVVAADDAGNVQALSARTGDVLWHAPLGVRLAAGVGSDGLTAAVVTQDNRLLALRGGVQLWRVSLPAQVYTAPLVAGGRIFVLAADRSLSAFDAANGFLLWQQKPDALAPVMVLRQGGLLMAAGGVLFAGISGHVLAFNPDNGSVLADVLVARPRGAGEAAQLVDVLDAHSRVGNSLCVRSFETLVGCIDLSQARLLWTRASSGASGVGGNAQLMAASDGAGHVQAWARADGAPLWRNETLAHRGLGAALLLHDAAIVGDAQGYVHVLSAADGHLANRLHIDNSAIVAPPVAAAQDLAIVLTARGTLAGIRVAR